MVYRYVRDPNDPEGKGGWIDRHVHVTGGGAADLGNSFIERWNSDVPIDQKVRVYRLFRGV